VESTIETFEASFEGSPLGLHHARLG